MEASSQPAISFGTFNGKKSDDLVTPASLNKFKKESLFWGDQVEFEDDNHEVAPVVVNDEEEQTKVQSKEPELPLGDGVKHVEIGTSKQVDSPSSLLLTEELWPTLTSTAKDEMQKVVSAATKIREEERARAKAVEDERKKMMDVNKAQNVRKDVSTGRGKNMYRDRGMAGRGRGDYKFVAGMAGRGRGDYKFVAPTPVLKVEPEKLVTTKEKPKHQLAAQLLGICLVEKKDDEVDENKRKRKDKNDIKQDEKKAAQLALLQEEEIEKRKRRNAKKALKRAEKQLLEEKEMEDKEREDKVKRKAKKKAAKKNVKADNIVNEEPPTSTLKTNPPPASSVMSKEVPLCKKKKTTRSLVLVITSLVAVSATVLSCIAFTDILF